MYDESKDVFKGVLDQAEIQDQESELSLIEPMIEQLLTKWMRILIKVRKVPRNDHGAFEELKTGCLQSIQMAYLDITKFPLNNDKNRSQVNQNNDTDKGVTEGLVQLSEAEIKSIETQFATQMRKAFWDKISEDLKAIPPRTQHFLVLFKEIRDRLDGLTPNNSRLIQENHDLMDLSIYGSLFERKGVTPEVLGDVLAFIVEDRLKKMVAPVDDLPLDTWYCEVKEKMVKELPSDLLVITVFQGLYEWLTKIETGVKEFMATNLKN